MIDSPTGVACWQATPRPLTDRRFWDAARRAPRFDRLWRDVLTHADEAPPRPQMPSASDYLAARRYQDRNAVDRTWHGGRQTLAALVLRRAVLGLDPHDLDDRLLDWLWAFLTQPTWVVSAHLPEKDLPASGSVQHDLAACEMAATLAETREVLGPWMDEVSSTLADSVAREIERRVLGPYGEGSTVFHWHPGPGNPNRHMNNWLGVCAGNILTACESLAAQGRPAPAARERAIQGLAVFFDQSFTESGECDEGMGYWSYGVGMAAAGMSRLSPGEIADRFDLRRLAQVADYPRRVHLFDDVFFSGNDAPLRSRPDAAFIPWLAALTGNDWLAAWSRRPGRGRGSLSLLLRALAAPDHQAPQDPPVLPPPPDVRLLPDQQVAILRGGDTASADGPLTVTLSGGTNGERHNHNDLGHFMIAVGDRVVVPDPGNLRYRADFFGPNRYTYRAAASWGHNCPVIAGHEQRPGSEAAGTILAWDADRGGLSLDLTSAYPPEAGLLRWTRSLSRDGDGFLLVDEYATAQPDQPITHVVWSLETPQKGNADAITLGPLNVTVSPSPVSFEAESHNPADLLLREFKGQVLHRLQWHFTTDADGALRVETSFE